MNLLPAAVSSILKKTLPTVTLLLISAPLTCGAEITVTTLDDEDDGLNSLTSSNDISLREAINHSSPNDTILFHSDLNNQTITLSHPDGQLSITKNLTIDASSLPRGITIDANGQQTSHRVLEIKTALNVALHGLTLTGGHSFSGGALYNNRDKDNSILSLYGCTLSDNSAVFGGGGLDHRGGGYNSTINLNDCTISGNSSNAAGGGISSSKLDGSNTTLNLNNCILSNNSSVQMGGGIAILGGSGNSLLIANGCTIFGNSASDAGGGIASIGGIEGIGNNSTTLTNCTLFDNSATFDGGGIFSSNLQGTATLSLISCTLNNNSTDDSGGAIMSIGGVDEVFNGTATTSLSNCTLSSNLATAGGGVANFGKSELTLSSCTISENFAKFGGGIISPSPLSVHNTIIAGNTAWLIGPDLLQNFGSITTATGSNLISSFTGVSFPTSSSTFILTSPADLRLAPLANYGGLTQTMHPLAGSPAVLTGNSTTRLDQRGFSLSGPPTIGAVKPGKITTITDETTLRSALNSSANTQGDIIHFHADLDGQSLTLASGQLNIPGTAHGLFIDASSLPSGFTIDANQLSRVFEIQQNSTVALQQLTFTGGKADLGGAILNKGSLSISSCILSENSATLGGGAIANQEVEGKATLNLFDCHISENSAPDGGGIYNIGINDNNATANLKNSNLSLNFASRWGGGIYSKNALLNLSYSTLSQNIAGAPGSGGPGFGGGFGGGIFMDGDEGYVTLILKSCTVAKNSATNGDGGGIYSSATEGEATLHLSDSTIFENTADYGGGIYNSGSSGIATLNINSCTVFGNSADEGGGVFSEGFLESATLNFNNSIITSNSALNGPDIFEDSAQSITTATGTNLISSISGSNISGTVAENHIIITADPKLAPFGQYGGPTQTMIPLPDSPSRNPSTSSPRSFDQRGFHVDDGQPDIGAVEFQSGADHLRLDGDLSNTDDDGDGSVFINEVALGTDPFTADPEHLDNPKLFFTPDGHPLFQFGYNPAAAGLVLWAVERTTDLKDWGAEPIYVSKDPGSFVDEQAPQNKKAFYRFYALAKP